MFNPQAGLQQDPTRAYPDGSKDGRSRAVAATGRGGRNQARPCVASASRRCIGELKVGGRSRGTALNRPLKLTEVHCRHRICILDGFHPRRHPSQKCFDNLLCVLFVSEVKIHQSYAAAVLNMNSPSIGLYFLVLTAPSLQPLLHPRPRRRETEIRCSCYTIA